jgi:FAD/FMN-containing dehydrogenase
MRNVGVDPRARVATVAGGALAKGAAVAAGAHNLVAALGNCGMVGMAGPTLGGGYGPLSGTCGLAADNLLAAEIVLADGRRVTVGPDAEPELLDDREQAAEAYGDNAARLRALKRRFDPDEVVASAIPLPEGWTRPLCSKRFADTLTPLVSPGGADDDGETS